MHNSFRYTDNSVPITTLPSEASCIGKDGSCAENGDSIYIGPSFKAIFDGATPKGTHVWDGKPGDIYVSHLLSNAMDDIDPEADARTVITQLNDVISAAYLEHNTSFEKLAPEERLQASAVIFSNAKKEVWVFGDCNVKINDRMYKHTRAGDKLLADLRAFYTVIAAVQGDMTGEEDVGREAILPFLKVFPCLANQHGEFGYDALNGGTIRPENVIVYPLKRGDRVIMGSDGYPELFDTLEETQRYLFRLVEKDAMCVEELRGTKGVLAGKQSFDDRSYVIFFVL